MKVEPADDWSRSFEAFVSRFAARFPRVESRRRMRCYVRGLLGDTVRKNGWTLAEAAGDAGPEGMQRLLNSYAWDTDGVRDDVRTAVVEQIGDAEHGALVVEETNFAKKGRKSAGVASQFSPAAGRCENAQVGVFLAYVSAQGRALIDRELYLPKEWISDGPRRRRAGIGEDVVYAIKPVLAQRMISRAARAGVGFGWVAGGESCGQSVRLRSWLENRGIAYVLAIPGNVMVHTTDLTGIRACQIVSGLSDQLWTQLGRKADTAAHRPHEWAAVDIRSMRGPGWRHWLLARRSLDHPAALSYYLCFGQANTPVESLARAAVAHRAIQETFRETRTATGLDHYQVRGYQAWYRHITLSMAAAAFLTIIARNNAAGTAPLTLCQSTTGTPDHRAATTPDSECHGHVRQQRRGA